MNKDTKREKKLKRIEEEKTNPNPTAKCAMTSFGISVNIFVSGQPKKVTGHRKKREGESGGGKQKKQRAKSLTEPINYERHSEMAQRWSSYPPGVSSLRAQFGDLGSCSLHVPRHISRYVFCASILMYCCNLLDQRMLSIREITYMLCADRTN